MATTLSARETEVVRLIAWGYTNKEIAAQLDLSVKTVETHKANAMHKLGVTQPHRYRPVRAAAGLAPGHLTGYDACRFERSFRTSRIADAWARAWRRPRPQLAAVAARCD